LIAPRIVRLAAALVIALAVLVPGLAAAHNAGRVELLVTNLQFTRGPQGLAVSADLVDRDSGEVAAGFAIVVTAAATHGASAGPLTLTDPKGTGRYEGLLALASGDWTVTARAEQGTSTTPALGSSKSFRVKVDATGAVQGAVQEDSSGETVTTVPQYGSRPVDIALEVRTDYTDALPSPLYIPLRARVTDAESGQPVADPYAVRAVVKIPGQASTEAYDFAYPHGTVEGAEAGVYNGVVIVPAGGRWTIVVNAYNIKDTETSRLPQALGVGQIEVEATGPALQTSQGQRTNDVAGNINPKAEESEVALLFVHTLVAAAWFGLAAVLAVMGLPTRRRLLSGQLSELLDRNVRKLTRGLLWSTVLVWGTGLLNLQKAVAFPPPLSSAQATRLFRLPYARPYTLALYTKIGLYLALTLAAVALVKEAKRRVAEFDDARFRADLAEATTSGSSVAAPVPGPGAIPFTPRRSATALATRPAPSVAVTPKPNGAPSTPASTTFRLAAASVALGSLGIILCVTILKYIHILSETVRGLQ
jgi:hypothetical protein